MIKKITLIAIITISMVTVSFGQRGYNRTHTFDVTTPVELSGKILKVETVKDTNGRYGRSGGGIHLTIRTGDKQSLVNLGPAAFLSSNNWEFKTGEMVTVKAFNGTGNSNGQLFAASVTRGGQQLALRDANGLPMWRQSLNRKGQGKGRGGRRNSSRGNW
jgi:hypothetical protein